MMKKTGLLTALLLLANSLSAQLSGTFTQTLNTNCLGQPCAYDGPTILINELMISPNNGDGSIIDGPSDPLSSRRGEWIELYNPNLCEPVDISCYYLGNYVQPAPAGGNGFRLPDNLIVPPGGFVLIRGINAESVPPDQLIQNGGNTIEITLPAYTTDDGVCSWGNRVWFPNIGGWFAFYDADGVPQDAVSWAAQGGIESEPCVAASSVCSSVASLPSYNDIPEDRKFYASPASASSHFGQSIRRIPDGGPWAGPGLATIGQCNSLPCIDVGASTCTGTATINVTGGTPPYTYLWDDSQIQMTQTAVGLCEGPYTVQVTDANGLVDSFTVNIENFVPEVTLNVSAEYCDYDPTVALVDYSPSAGAGQTGDLTGAGVTNFEFTPADAGVGVHDLTYTFTDENGCTNSATDQITVHPTPELTMDIYSEYCAYDDGVLLANVTPPENGPTGSGEFTGPGVTSTGFGATIFAPTVAGPGLHTLTYTFTTIHGCVNDITDDILVNPIPVVSFFSDTLVGFEPLPIQFTNTSTGANNYTWFFGDNQTSSSPGPIVDHTFAEFGVYDVLLVGEASGCTDSASLTITVNINPITYNIPNVFSPNGDDSNPFFTLMDKVGFMRVAEFEVVILNRWGNVVATFTDKDFAWDGKFTNGNDAPEGVYFYKLYMTSEMGDVFEEHGFFHLVRE